MSEKKVKWLLKIVIEVDGHQEDVGTFGYYNLDKVAEQTEVTVRTLNRNLGKKMAFKRFNEDGEYVFFWLNKN